MKEIILTEAQQAALNAMIAFVTGEADFSLMVLEGYAGTGKTTLIGELIRALAKEPSIGRLALAAPTNKAVRVLKDKIEQQAGVTLYPNKEWDEARGKPVKHAREYGSIHSFLGLQLSEREDGSEECLQKGEPSIHEYDLVIVDECSMLNADMVRRIMLLRRTALVLFVGDPAQLPPVNEDHDVSTVFRHVTNRVTLTDVVRQAKDNPIINLSIAIRQAMERNNKLAAVDLAETLPPLPAKAGFMVGGQESAMATLLYEVEQERDARIIAYTNDAVLTYNAEIHARLHGITPHPFVVGERVIAHGQFSAQCIDQASGESMGAERVLNSEELVITALEERAHPLYGQQYSSCRLTLRRDSGMLVRCYVADNQSAVARDVAQLFAQWRQAKTLSTVTKRTDIHEAARLDREARQFSEQAWALRKAFAPLRHAYALTAHKSQGSTFDTAIVDFNNLSQMRTAFQFNRALYVAATRASEHLAIVV